MEQQSKKSTRSKSVSNKKKKLNSPKKRARGPKTGRKTVKKSQNGPVLFDQVCKLTGIPTDKIKTDLHSILDRKNMDVENLTLEQLRIVAATYLREIMGGLLDRNKTSA